MSDREDRLNRILAAAPVVPVLTIEDRATAVPLARALVAGGLTALEVTLRTAAGLDCIRAIKAEVEGCNVGAGTVLDPKQVDDAVAAGATFLVSPGASPRLIDAALASPVPFLPGVATAGEAMALGRAGIRGRSSSSRRNRRAVSPTSRRSAHRCPGIRFCPTGGVGAKNAADYLALQNVICVGGSWVAPADALAQGNWTRITALSKEAAQLKRGGNGVRSDAR